MSASDSPTGASGSGHEQPFDLSDSDQDTQGGMGVSSETEDEHGHTTGTRDVGPAGDGEETDRPEQSPAGAEVKPDPPIPPKSGYNSHDPASDDDPYDATPMI